MSDLKKRFGIGHVLAFVCLFGFSVLLLGGYWIYESRAPIPAAVQTEAGESLFTREQILGGQAVYQKYGLMDWGSVLGHGTYYGPDFTAEVLHERVGLLRDMHAVERGAASYADLDFEAQAGVAELVRSEIKTNRYDAASDTLTLSARQAAAFAAVEDSVRKRFTEGESDRALPAGVISEDHLPAERSWVAQGDQIHQLTAFFWWTSWLAGVERPEGGTTFTNNWPYDPEAGNVSPSSANLWSGVSVAMLLLALSVVFFAWFRGRFYYDDAYEEGTFPAQRLDWLPVYPSQRKSIKYFVVAGALFLAQVMLGGYLAHYYVEGGGFYGIDMAAWLPFTIAKTWHLQLAVFWIATAWLGMGIYVAPLIGGGEPKKQGLLVDLLFGAVVLVAVGSLAGEWLGVKGYLGSWWWVLGHSGWEIIELGMLWKVLLAVGFGLWLFIVGRAVKGALAEEKRFETVGLVRLFLISAIAIPAMFAASFLITPGSHLTMADYWRWWVIHLWVEGMFEVFAVVVLGILLVNMGLVTRRSASRALKFQLAVLLGSGIIGIGHHYYWIGAGEAWMAMGSVFSALEVIPLSLLAVEAVEQWVIIKRGGHAFPYRHVFLFLMAVAFWNLIGAGVFGFLINLPTVSYTEHGSFLTANHGHAALMGVFGMLAIALALYCLRNVVNEKGWAGRLFTISFWGLNVGLAGMCAITLAPVGFMQMAHAEAHGFWAARSLEFYQQDSVQLLLWLRMIPDSIFIVAGVLPLLGGLLVGFRNLRPATPIEEPLRESLRRVVPKHRDRDAEKELVSVS
ncbi:MAG: nitric-oxide reductase large subunit [Planctomycetes bacterium]|nr:nitric-oxide reductase large subunit [Acidobacteriota bacterium]MCB9902925.1 nitric-oxide reductase large subunit [Planctomycetota bacterium]